MMHRIGFDLGGTKIECIVIDGEDRILFRERLPTPRHDYHAILATIEELFAGAKMAIGAGEFTIGMGIPGALDEARNIRNANTTVLIGKPMPADLTEMLGSEVAMANDANCFALSEATDGAARDHGSVFGVILGTGAGGGLVVDGKIVEGANRLAGEWGHNPFPFWGDTPKNRRCYCGKRDCIEQIVAGPALAMDYRDATGTELSAKQVIALSDSGDEAALAVTGDYIRNLGKALATVVNFFDPEAIVLGGGVSNFARLYSEVPAFIEEFAFNTSGDPTPLVTKLVPNKWGDSSGVRGAAWLGKEGTPAKAGA